MFKIKASTVNRLYQEGQDGDVFLRTLAHAMVGAVIKKEVIKNEVWLTINLPTYIIEKLVEDGDVFDLEVKFL